MMRRRKLLVEDKREMSSRTGVRREDGESRVFSKFSQREEEEVADVIQGNPPCELAR